MRLIRRWLRLIRLRRGLAGMRVVSRLLVGLRRGLTGIRIVSRLLIGLRRRLTGIGIVSRLLIRRWLLVRAPRRG